MQNLSKSKLLSFRQCPKRLWLEVHRPELQTRDLERETRLQVGHEVGDVARKLYDPTGSGAVIDVELEGFGSALTRSTALLTSSAPIFEAGFAAEGALAFADIMLPVGNKSGRSWKIVEVKSSTSIKDYHRDDIAIQAFVASAAGVPLNSIALAHINGDWLYPGDENYDGLLIEDDLTVEAFERRDDVKEWIVKSHALVDQTSEPEIQTGPQCSDPFECGFHSYCQSQEPQPEYPVEWLPALRSKVLREFIQANVIRDLRDVPNDYLDERQKRVKAQTISGEPYFDQVGAAAELAQYNPPASFIDFETIQFAVPIWRGTRPYQHIPFQFSCHKLSQSGELDHSEFLDLSGDDPSELFAEALISACDPTGPIFVYNAAFETTRIAELAERFLRLRASLLAINARVVDLLPVARRHYYHPSQHGSWSIKKVLPTIAADLSYDTLAVQDGGMAMAKYLEAIHPETVSARKHEIRRELLEYCSLDTNALIRLWHHFTGN